MSDKKVIKYFGAHYCPHSNKNSAVYRMINEDFKEKYPDVEIQVYMSEDVTEDQKKEFFKADAKYVPTVTNGKYAKIDLELPKNYNTEDKSMDEMSDVLHSNIYSQLDKEPDREIPNLENTVQETTSNSRESLEQSGNSIDTFENLLNEKYKNKYIYFGILILSLIILFVAYKYYKKTNK